MAPRPAPPRKIERPTPRRVFALAEALGRGRTVAEISGGTGIDPWFLEKMKRISCVRDRLDAARRSRGGLAALPADLLRDAKEAGFSDDQIATAPAAALWR